MKNESRKIVVLWILIVAGVAGETFLVFRHLDAGSGGTSGVAPMMQMNADVQQSDPASVTPALAVATQRFSYDGYELSIPASWGIERTSSDTVAIHPDAASSAACKIEISAFPFSSGVDRADWIARRIGADPSVTIAERSSEEVSLASGTATKWTGTIDTIQTTLVYAFGSDRAYEIAPSVVGEGTNGDVPCDDVLQEFLSGLTI